MSEKPNYESKNKRYLKGIKENDISTLREIYKDSLPEVTKYIKKNSGNEADAKDVFQEGILVIFKKIQSDSLVLTTSFHVFLFMVCKRIWLKKLKKKSKAAVTLDDVEEFVIEESIEDRWIQSRKWKLFNEKFSLISEECQKVLKMLFNGKSGNQIAQAMGYTEEYAKRKKYKCKLSLTEIIRKDPEYKNLTSF
ncbi:MAG: sigma-70 family RNA polymerase sigma factor [Bacteroidota bacterium]